jgi:hypothetical protein
MEVFLHFRFQIQFDDHLGDPIPNGGGCAGSRGYIRIWPDFERA